MPKYLFAYHGGDFPEALGEAQGRLWTEWLNGLGAKVLDQGGPVHPGKTVIAIGQVIDNGGANPVTGYHVIQADDMDEAIAIAKACPQTRPPHQDGTIEIAEIIEF